MTRTRNSLPSSSSVSVRKSDTGGAGIQSVTIAVAIRLTSRVIETMTEIMALLLRVGSSLAMDNAAKALQFPNVAASLNRIEHQPSKLRGAGSSPAAVARQPKKKRPFGALCHRNQRWPAETGGDRQFIN